MEHSLQLELFSDAFVNAVAAAAGFSIAKTRPDTLGVDWIVSSDEDPYPKLDIQLKATTQHIHRDDGVHFRLEVGDYTMLRSQSMVPRILVVVLVPRETDAWMTCRDDTFSLHHGAYWLSLRTAATTSNSASITVILHQLFTPSALRSIMTTIGKGEAP